MNGNPDLTKEKIRELKEIVKAIGEFENESKEFEELKVNIKNEIKELRIKLCEEMGD